MGPFRLATAALLSLLLVSRGSSIEIGEVRLSDAAGKAHALKDYASAKAVVLVVQGNGCPISRQSAPAIERLRKRFIPRGVAFLLLNASPQDDVESVAKEAADFGIRPPVLIDREQELARTLKITRTAEALLLDPKTWTVLYRGAIDDRLTYGAQRAKARREYLRDALEDVLAGRPVRAPESEVRGCLINLDPALRKRNAPTAP